MTLIRKDGTVLYDSEPLRKLANHSDRPNLYRQKNEKAKVSVIQKPLQKTFYYAVKLDDETCSGGKTVIPYIFHMDLKSCSAGISDATGADPGVCFCTDRPELIRPVNDLDLEHPLNNVCYEELRPLLVRVDEQNRQIRQQVKELEGGRGDPEGIFCKMFPMKELKTPLMSISGYAELMMNGMVPADHIQEFSGRIYHESRLFQSGGRYHPAFQTG